MAQRGRQSWRSAGAFVGGVGCSRKWRESWRIDGEEEVVMKAVKEELLRESEGKRQSA
jgi:hypothetical protein